ncbi:MAG: pyridoxal-phosphate dependent enzyme, partial [Cellulomonadaceae bacterium]|nr:pyridoxal-phosphate dependent enzyme [Cellulomonadaceae bacterium]
MVDTVQVADIVSAAELLQAVVQPTPVLHFRLLEALTNRPVFLKCENLQRAGSFKIRGAFNRMAKLTEAEKVRGVVAASAGNHAQGVALAAQMLGIKAVIFMPADAPLPKVEATRAYGAEIRLGGRNVDECLALARAEAQASGRTLIHPFDHPDVVAGQGTLALEILEQVPDVETVIIPVGGGGLIAGIATVFAERAPHVKVIGVQAENAAAYPESLIAHKPITRLPGATMADGIAIGTPGLVPLEILSRLGVEVRTVSEVDMARALLALVERA